MYVLHQHKEEGFKIRETTEKSTKPILYLNQTVCKVGATTKRQIFCPTCISTSTTNCSVSEGRLVGLVGVLARRSRGPFLAWSQPCIQFDSFTFKCDVWHTYHHSKKTRYKVLTQFICTFYGSRNSNVLLYITSRFAEDERKKLCLYPLEGRNSFSKSYCEFK